jgi:hypothetical protein
MENQDGGNGPDRHQAWREKKRITFLVEKIIINDQMQDLGIDVI